MKRSASIGVLYLSVFVGFSLIYWLCFNFPQKKNKQKEIKTEYKIELINQDTIKVYSVSNDTIYICKMDKLVEVIEKDNL
jgi:CMP-N-acetylneuraminic acid synthetase